MARKQTSPGCFILFQLPFMVIGLLVAVAAGAGIHTSYRIVHDYEQSVCKITGYDYSVSRSKRRVTGYYGIVRVELSLDGHAYDDTEPVGERAASSDAAVASARSSYPLGSEVTCFYDPEAPTEIVLQRSGTGWIPLALFAAFWNFVTWIGAGSALRRLLRRRPEEPLEPAPIL